MKPKHIGIYNINNKYYFVGGDIFTCAGWNLLLNSRLGNSIIVDDDCTKILLEQQLPNDDLMFKLHQRGFIRDKKADFCIKKINTCPNFFLINLTNNCNLRCKYCFRNIEHLKKDEIEDSQLKSICEYILQHCEEQRIRKFSIQFWGGEPLLLFDKIKYVQDFFLNYGINPQFIIETNGTLLNKKIANELVERKIKIGISIDGPEYLHNFHRPFMNGEGSFNKVLQGIQYLKKACYNEFGVITVITKKNIHEASNILNYFAKELNLHRIKFNLIKENIFSPESMELSNLSNEEIDSFFEDTIKTIVRLNQEGYSIYERNICDKMMNLLSKQSRNICSSKGCQGGYKIISFNRKGDIYPCDMLDHEEVRIGNIAGGKNLLQMIENAVERNIFFTKKEISDCKTCSWRGFCEGGCTASMIYRETVGVDKMECRVNRILYPKLIRLILKNPETVLYLTNNQICFYE